MKNTEPFFLLLLQILTKIQIESDYFSSDDCLQAISKGLISNYKIKKQKVSRKFPIFWVF